MASQIEIQPRNARNCMKPTAAPSPPNSKLRRPGGLLTFDIHSCAFPARQYLFIRKGLARCCQFCSCTAQTPDVSADEMTKAMVRLDKTPTRSLR